MRKLHGKQVDLFREGIRGEVLLPDDPGFDQVRTVWNAMIDRKPAMIVRCAGCADVIAAIAFARKKELMVSVRGGGHNIAGNAVCSGGLMIDLSPMSSLRIDPDAQRAYVEPGATLGDFDHEAQAFGLATPLGINSTTGVSGLTLGGGFGWLTRRYGMTVDNLLGAEVITADGHRKWASEQQNSDLFWAIRGGGGNFGIVTLFEFRLHQVGPEVLSGLVVFPFSKARQVLMQYRQLAPLLPDDMSAWVVVRHAPPLPFLPTEVHGEKIAAVAIFSLGDSPSSQRFIDQIRGFGEAIGEHVGLQFYTDWQRAFDPLLTPGARNYWKSHNFTELNDGALETVLEYAATLPSPQSEVFIGQLGGQASRISPEDTAYAHRNTQFVLNVHGRWEEPDQDEACIGWAREFFRAATPYAAGGVYVNFMTEEEVDRIASAYGPNYKRLTKVKAIYDPDNFFRLNQNIKPAD